MPTTHTPLTTVPSRTLSARLCSLAVEAQWVLDELLARQTGSVEIEMLLAGPEVAFALLIGWLEDALFDRCDKRSQLHALEDRHEARLFAAAHSSHSIVSSRSSRLTFPGWGSPDSDVCSCSILAS